MMCKVLVYEYNMMINQARSNDRVGAGNHVSEKSRASASPRTSGLSPRRIPNL